MVPIQQLIHCEDLYTDTVSPAKQQAAPSIHSVSSLTEMLEVQWHYWGLFSPHKHITKASHQSITQSTIISLALI